MTNRRLILVACLLPAVGGCDERFFDPTVTNVGWVDVAQLPEPRSSFGAAVFRDRIYVAGGWNDGFMSNSEVFRYDGDRDEWELVGNLPTRLAEFELVVASDTLFAVGGVDATTAHPSKRLYAYDEAGDTWLRRPWIPDERHGNAVFSFDGKIYLVGGPMNEATIHGPRVPGDSVLVYDVFQAQWSYLDPMPTPRFGVVGVWHVDRFLTIGGFGMISGVSVSPIVDAYDPSRDAWSPVTMDPRASGEPAVALVGEEVHLMGGTSYPSGSGTHRVYDTVTDTWDVRGELWVPIGAAKAVAYRNELYLIGGRVQMSTINRVMVYRPNE